MRKFKLLTLLAAAMMTANMWAGVSLGDGTGLEWLISGLTDKTLIISYDGEGTGVMPDYNVDGAGAKSTPGWTPQVENIVEIQLPEGLTNIGKHAFAGMTNEALTSLTIPSTVTSIGNQAIRISHLETLTCNPTTAPTLGLTSITAHAETFSIVYPCASGESYVNKWVEYYSYLEPEDGCLTPKPEFAPSGDCGTDAHYAFNGSTGVLTISGTGAIENYTNISYQPWASYRGLITSVVIGNGITAIGDHAFNSLSNLTTVTFTSTSSLTTIGQSAFAGCSSLASITIPAGVTTINQYAFNNTGLTSISIPASVETIGNFSFRNCASLATVTFASPSSALTSIGSYAFAGTALTSVTIPATTNGLSIGGQAFAVAGITSVSFASPSNVTTIDDRAFSGTGITSINIPATKSNLTLYRAFESCTSLATVTFDAPSKVTSIGMRTFEGCTALTTITIPASVGSVSSRAFRSCSNLKNVYFEPANCPSIANNTFQYCHAELKLWCPDESGLIYANTVYTANEDYWNILYMYPSGDRAPSPALGGFCGKDGGEDMLWDIFWNDEAQCIMLNIYGDGLMEEWDFLNGNWAPWKDFRSYIKYIQIDEGVTSIGGSAFVGCDQVRTFVIPSTVTSIGADAFYGCDHPEVEVYCNADPSALTWNDRNCDDFLSYSPGTGTIRSASYTPGTLHLQETKCYVSSEHLATYVDKWYKGSTDFFVGTDVNVFFAVGLNDANDAAGINAILDDTDGDLVPVMTVTRPMTRDGYFVTLCLPFNMSSEQIAASPLADAEIKEFTNAEVVGGSLELTFSPVTEIEAGKPYFVKFDGSAKGAALDRLDFINVTIDKTAPTPVTCGDITMIGTYVPKSVSAQSGYNNPGDVLFLASENRLYWPNTAGNIKPFRCYFQIATSSPKTAVRKGMPARIIEAPKAPTAIDNTNSDNVQSTKTFENGQLIIIKNGVRYNAQGQVVE